MLLYKLRTNVLAVAVSDSECHENTKWIILQCGYLHQALLVNEQGWQRVLVPFSSICVEAGKNQANHF